MESNCAKKFSLAAVLCFFVALGKEKDQDLLNLKKNLIAFNVNEKRRE